MLVSLRIVAQLCLLVVVPAFCTRFPTLDVLKPFSSNDVQTQAVFDLLARVVPDVAGQIEITVSGTSALDQDSVELGPASDSNKSVHVNASSGVAAAWGVQQYLRNFTGAHFSWDGNQVKMPQQLPKWPSNDTKVFSSIGRFRYFGNVCTYSYSMLWWNFSRWEQHIDWMALQGINFPLLFVGQEALWLRVFVKFGLSENDVLQYLTGPAFLAWNRMGNLKHWGGPVNKQFFENQLVLQKKIVARCIQLGMLPVLPAFAGHVPDAFAKLYPQSHYENLQWNGFNASYSSTKFLDPDDALFVNISQLFMKELQKEIGLYHAYNADPFNEMVPPSYSPDYISKSMLAVFKGISLVDADAIWVMQAWIFVSDQQWLQPNTMRALLTTLPQGRLLLLDLFSELDPIYPLTYSYLGQPFIWNTLTNFGGRLGMIGSFKRINQGLQKALQFPNSTLVGVGITMEGMFNNYAIFQLTLDRAWTSTPIKIAEWTTQYAASRYGIANDALNDAWNYLAIWYDPADICEAWDRFVEAISNDSVAALHSNLLMLDLVDVTRQVLQVLAAKAYQNFTTAYFKRSPNVFASQSNYFLNVLTDMEAVLNTHTSFMVGPWLQQATDLAYSDHPQNETAQEFAAELYRYNMRNQITLWGPRGEILDYARKQWGGLLDGYYRQRWKLFAAELMYDLIHVQSFNQSEVDAKLFTTIEEPWTFSDLAYPLAPIGDTTTTTKLLHRRYISQCKMLTL